MAADRQRVVVVVGPTAAGKTELAAALARELGGEIVGADSRQVYRYMDIGTAKPSPGLRREIRHHLVDIVDPDQDYDVASWRDQAMTAIADIHARGGTAIVCGGTGLYVRSLLRGLFAGPAADRSVREQLEAAERADPGTLYSRLSIEDPASAVRIHRNDLLRVVRALEVLELTGKPMSAWHAAHGLAEEPFEYLMLEVKVPRQELYARIDQRSRAMVEAGLLEEMRGLLARGYRGDLRAFDAIGYRQARSCLAEELGEEALAEEVAQATRRYAKRQLVWLRGQGGAVAIASGNYGAALAQAHSFLGAVAKHRGNG